MLSTPEFRSKMKSITTAVEDATQLTASLVLGEYAKVCDDDTLETLENILSYLIDTRKKLRFYKD